MIVQKWVAVTDLKELEPEIYKFKNTLHLLWTPQSVDDFLNYHHLITFQQYSNAAKIIINADALLPLLLPVNETEALVIQQFTRFFFQINYYKEADMPLLVVTEGGYNKNSLFISKLTAFCTEQGFNSLKIVKYTSGNTYYLQKESLLNTDFYKLLVQRVTSQLCYSIEQLKVNQNVNEIVAFIFSMQNCSVAEVLQLFEKAEEQSIEDHKALQLLPLLLKAKQESTGLGTLVARKERENKNLVVYLHTQKVELQKILKWYDHEYEVLPLWYKRFGHIIKVLMGQRSFRSLFNDNVKKYKQ